jgi:hypothetical protein
VRGIIGLDLCLDFDERGGFVRELRRIDELA